MKKIAFALLGLLIAAPALAQNYTATPGAGLSFGSKLVAAVHYPQQTMCDPATPANCVAVNASGQITITNTSFASTQSGTWNITNISGTVSLPTGAATSALQTTGNSTLSTINTTLGSPFQAGGSIGNTTFGATQSGAWTVNPTTAANWGIGATAAAVPANANYVGMLQGGNLVGMTGTSGNLNVQCANCSGSGVSTVDAAAFTASTSLFAGGGGFFQTTATNNPLTNGQQGMWQMTANRAGFVNLRDTAGVAIGTSAAEVFVGGRGTAGTAAGGVLTVQGVASMTPLFVQSGTVPVSTMNSANANNGTNAALAGVFDDTSPTAITENQFGFLRMSANRNLYGTIRDAAGNERGANVDASNRLTTAPTMVSGSVASGAYASGALASGSIASGAMVDLGAQADTVCATDTGTCTHIALTKKINATLTAMNTNVQAAIPAGTNLIGDVNLRQGGTALSTSNPIFNRTVAGATGGASTTGNIAANNTTAVVVKASAGTLYGVQLAGLGSAPAYLKIYNATSATCGSGTPVKRLMIPAASTAANGAGSNITFGPVGVNFSTGITYCITTGIGDSDTTAPAASTFLVNLDWN